MKEHRSSLGNRRFLAAEESLVRKLRNLAETKNQTLYALTNKIIEQAINANDLEEDLEKIIHTYRIVKMAKENGSVLVPREIWYQVLEIAIRKNGSMLKETFHDSGVWYGKYFSTVLSGTDSLEGIRNAFQTIFWNTESLDIIQNRDQTILTCVEPTFTKAHTEFLSLVFEGIMHSLGYQTDGKKVSRGLLTLTFTKNGLGKEEDAPKER